MTLPRDRRGLQRLVSQGESATREFKRSTGELRDAMRSVCAFLNGRGGVVLFGIRPDGRIEGQMVTDATLRELAQCLDRFEPPLNLDPVRLPVGDGREVLMLEVPAAKDSIPFSYDGRAYERVSSTTRVMPQRTLHHLLLARSLSRSRWESLPAEIEPRDIDREALLRAVRVARDAGRLFDGTGRNTADLLDRFGLRTNGQILRAAVVLFGKHFLPHFPQCELRMARFLGTTKAEFLDQRQVRGGAFKLLEEAEIFCQRHLPVAARIVDTQMQRLESHLIPPSGLREILVNALVHRDYSIAGGAVSVAIFDDRLEIWSAGGFPLGITPESLSDRHQSVQRNPIIADVFHRVGYIERWGRGTNRVIEMCQAAGTPPPEFAEITGAAVVTFRVPVRSTPQVTPQATPQDAPQVAPHVLAMLRAAKDAPASRQELQEAAGVRDRKHFREAVLGPALEGGLLERTLPDKPTSGLQRYRLTALGRQAVRSRRK